MADLEIRCSCSRRPLLAKAGEDQDGNWYLQVRHLKSGKVLAHVVAMSGVVRVLCRDCGRWTTVKIKRMDITRHNSLPDSLDAVI